MGLMSKLKNIFFEEEYVEVEEPEKKEKKKEKPIAKKIEMASPKKEEVIEEAYEDENFEEEEKTNLLDKDVLKNDNNFKFPMILEEDFIDEEPSKNENVHVQEKKATPYGNYEYNKEEYRPYTKKEERNKGFKPSPIISPIYGVLDKNYKKEEIVTKREIKVSSYSSNKMDLDSVRAKAYGSLEHDIINSFEEDSIEKEEENEINLLVDMSEEGAPVVDKVTIGDALEYFEDLGLEYNIDYKDHNKEKATGRRTDRIIDKEEDEEEKVSEIEVENSGVKDEDNELEDNSLEDNLFDLIDSMYEDKE